MNEIYKIMVIEAVSQKCVYDCVHKGWSEAITAATDLWLHFGSGNYVDVRFYVNDSDAGIVARIGGLGFPDNK